MAEFKFERLRYTWRSAWTSNTRYNPDDIVSYGSKVYVCVVKHDSQADFYGDLNFLNNEIPPKSVPRWVLLTEGKEWRSEWDTSTLYNLGDIVKYGGIVYLCTEGHTSADVHEEFYDDLDANRWTLFVDSGNWAQNWTNSTFYKVNDTVKYGGIVYRCVESHISSVTDIAGLEADIDRWEVVNITDDWQGDWTTGYRYKLNDIVKYGGIVYRCTLQHTSASTVALGLEANSDNWTIVHSGVEYKGDFATPVRYKLNDVVKYGSYLYKVNTNHTSSESDGFLSANFDVFCPGQEFDNEWTDDVVYQTGDIVRYGGYIFRAKQQSLGITPDYDQEPPNPSWELLFQNSNVRGEWSSSASYRLGDVVRRNGNLFVALKDSIGQDTDILTDDSTVNADYWELIIPGEKWLGIWGAGNTYVEGDVVILKSTSYRALRKHVSDAGNAPDDDGGFYWETFIEGNPNNVLREVGDILSFGVTEDGSSIGNKRISAGNTGQTLYVNTDDIEYTNFNSSNQVFYVALNGTDDPDLGRDQNSPWRTLRYALEYVEENVSSGYTTIFVRTGEFEEILPMTIPAFTAVVGDELRSTVIKPGQPIFTDLDNTIIERALIYLTTITPYIVAEQEIGTADEEIASFGTRLYGTVSQVFTGTPATSVEANAYNTLPNQWISQVINDSVITMGGSNTPTTDAPTLNAYATLVANKEFIKSELTGWITATQPSYSFDNTELDKKLNRLLDAFNYDLYYGGNYKTNLAATYFKNATDFDLNKKENMFLVRDGTGLRNCTLVGLEGTLGDFNANLTRRPTAGAYASLDPGWGVSDDRVWVGSKSPYIQNVTTFGTGCIGYKVDGDLHAGGNQTIVTNDFTQVLSDGIGIWCNGSGKTEAVSVFTYYNHIGYLCTLGGKIRGTNGNCSYGTYGAVAEGFNVSEAPIEATVNNRYYEADVSKIQTKGSEITKFFFSNAGNEYTSANFELTGSGINAEVEEDEFRDNAVFEVRITDPGDSGVAGGGGYKFTTNSAQAGNTQQITIAASDDEEADVYKEMRLYLTSGTGAGQYGYIAEYNPITKIATIANENYPKKTVLETQAIGNIVRLDANTNLQVGDPVIFTGTHFGNIQANTVYYIDSVEGNQNITISTSPDRVGFNIANADYTDRSLNVAARGIVFSDDGVKAYAVTGDNVLEYFLYSAYNIDTATLINTVDVSTISSSFSGITFNNLGTRLYLADETNGNIKSFGLSVAFDTTTIDLTPATFDVNGAISVDPVDILFNNTGSKMYVIESTVSNQKIHQFSCSTEFDITTATTDSTSLDTSTQTTNNNLAGAVFNSDGTKIFVNDSDAVYRYGFSSGFDLSSASYDSVTYDFTDTVSEAIGNIEIDDDGTKMYIVDTSGEQVYQFDIFTDSAFGLISETGDMELHHIGWNNINPGFPAETLLDTTTNYTIEPRVTFSAPGYNVNSGSITSAPWQDIAFGNDLYVAVSTGTTAAYSSDGVQWTASTLPSDQPWKKVKFGNGTFVAVGHNGVAAKTTDGITWTLMSLPNHDYTSVAYGDGAWVAVSLGGDKGARSVDLDTWTEITLPTGSDWIDIEYGKGLFVAVSSSNSSNSETAYSDDLGQTWTEGNFAGGCEAISYGNNRFVAIEGGFVGSNNSFISFDGITWQVGSLPSADEWTDVTYGQGLFVAVAKDAGSCALSEDGLHWESNTLSGGSSWKSITFGNNPDITGRFIAISGGDSAGTAIKDITTGTRAQARVQVVNQRISAIDIFEPGSGYASPPAFVLTDPNNTSDVAVSVRTHTGVIASPSIVNGGSGFANNTVFATITGDGFKDQFQIGSDVVVSGMTRIPGPGDNINFASIDDFTYKLLSATILGGTAPNIEATLKIAKPLDRDEAPDHGTSLEIRQQYSQVRVSGHDFLEIGKGNFTQTNYPNVLFPIGTVKAPENEVLEADGGRVFYTSTDELGNFRVGELFAVEQATGIVTLNADFFELEGLEELVLGGVSVGGSGVVVREFSTDPTFTADSNNIIPTQRAIKAFITSRVSGGGSDAITGQMTAGVVTMGPDSFGSTTGEQINIPVKMTFQGGIDGVWLQQAYFLAGNNE